jgi:TPR repeat protein
MLGLVKRSVILRTASHSSFVKYSTTLLLHQSSDSKNDPEVGTFLRAASNGDSESAFQLGVLLRKRVLSKATKLDLNKDGSSSNGVHEVVAASGPEVLKEIEVEKKAARLRRKEKLRRKREEAKGNIIEPEVLITKSSDHIADEEQQLSWQYWLRRASNAGHTTAQVYLGNALLHHNPADDTGGTALDIKDAARLYAQAAAHNSPDALFNLGTLYFSGAFDRQGVLVIASDPQRSIENFTQAANLGDAEAQYWLGHCHISGECGEPEGGIDMAMGLDMLQRAAKQGHPASLYYLCTAYRSGLTDRSGSQVLAPNSDEFRRILADAVKADDADALFCMADLYLNGTEGMPHDEVQAVRYLEKACESNHIDSLTTLGAMHYSGRGGLVVNKRRAFELYNEAADLGSREAWLNLASMHYNGDGVPKSESLAREILSHLKKLENEGCES